MNMNKDFYQNKSSYWKKFPDQYTIDEKGNVTIHEDADEEVKKSYKQYTIEQMMAGYFVEEEEDEEEFERTFTVEEDVLNSLKAATETKKMHIPELDLKKDNSMYSWMSQTQYYKIQDGEYIFSEDTPEEILTSYKNYKRQVKRLNNMKKAHGNVIFDFLLGRTGINSLGKKKKK